MERYRNGVLILGLGNSLMGDDGLGIHVASELQKLECPQGVVVMDAGTSAVQFLDEISRSQNLIVIDAVKMGGEPGSFYRLTLDGASGRARVGQDWVRQGSHGLPLPSVVALSRTLTGLPIQVVVFGVEPMAIGLSTELSPVVRRVLPSVVNEVGREIDRMFRANSCCLGEGDSTVIP